MVVAYTPNGVVFCGAGYADFGDYRVPCDNLVTAVQTANNPHVQINKFGRTCDGKTLEAYIRHDGLEFNGVLYPHHDMYKIAAICYTSRLYNMSKTN